MHPLLVDLDGDYRRNKLQAGENYLEEVGLVI